MPAIGAERLRVALEELRFGQLSITASFGVSARCLGAETTQQMLDQADKCLYAAKRHGRNQVVRWDQLPDDFDLQQAEACTSKVHRDENAHASPQSIPYNAVSALLSALAYRDAATAAHSTRVADLCAATARGIMSVADAYVLEIAALLHDIGKIGVPDSILLKPGPLTEQEWRVMRMHDRIGVEIIDSSFACPQLTANVRGHHANYSGDPKDPTKPKREEIPVAARILAIADAFDAMTSDRVFRKGRSQKQAFQELRRCAGDQFDPELVERFIEIVVQRGKPAESNSQQVSKQVALAIGVQVERIAQAVDAQDFQGLSSLVERLESAATKNGLHAISAQAHKLAELTVDDPDLVEIVETTHELLDLCRTTQRAYVDVVEQLA